MEAITEAPGNCMRQRGRGRIWSDWALDPLSGWLGSWVHRPSRITDEQYQPQQMSESRARALKKKVIVKAGSIGTPFANEKLLLTQ